MDTADNDTSHAAHQQELEARQYEDARAILTDVWQWLMDHQDIDVPMPLWHRIDAAKTGRPVQFASEHQRRLIRQCAQNAGFAEADVLRYVGLPSLDALPADRVLSVLTWLRTRVAA